MCTVSIVGFEVFTAVTMKNAVFSDVAPCRSCVNRRFGEMYRLHLQGRKIHKLETSVSRWLADCYMVPHPRRRHSSVSVVFPLFCPNPVHRVYATQYCDCERADLEILTDLHVVSPSEHKRVFLGMSFVCVCVCVCARACMYVCMYVCMMDGLMDVWKDVCLTST
jgi:hypothetical protein